MSITIKPWKNSDDEYEVKKWTYNPEKKRAIPSSLGRLCISWISEPKNIFDKCTEDEKKEIRAFISATKKGRYQVALTHIDRNFLNLETGLNDAIKNESLKIEQLEKLEQLFADAKKLVSAEKKRLAKIETASEEKNKANNEDLAQQNNNANV